MSFSLQLLRNYVVIRKVRPGQTRPDILTHRVVQNFVLQKVSTTFVLKELSKLKVTKSWVLMVSLQYFWRMQLTSYC